MQLVFLNRYFSPDHSATSQLLGDLAFHLAARGHRVQVVTSRLRYDDPEAALPPQESVRGVEVHRIWTSRFGRGSLPGRAMDYLTFYLSAALALWRLTDSGSLVIAKTDPPLLSLIAAPICGRRRARLVNWLQDLFPEVAIRLGVRGLGGRFGRWLTALRNRSLHAATLNVALGERMRERLITEGVDPARIRVIPNWADGGLIRPLDLQRLEGLRREQGVAGRFVIGYSGNLGRAHEIDTLLGAVDRLRDAPEVLFLFTGGGALMDRLRDAAGRRGLTNLRFEPYQPRERLAESLAIPDLHLVILRPELEGLIVPSKLYGILAAGRPLLFIGDPNGEIARVIADSGAGYAVPSGDPELLVERIRELQHDPARRAELGVRARADFERRFALGHALTAWEQLIEEFETGV